MEVQHSRSRIGQKNDQNAIGIPMISSSDSALMPFMGASRQALLTDPAVQYQLLPSSNSKHCSKIRHSRVDSVIAKMMKLGESLDGFAQGIREHVKLGPKLGETVKGKLRLGARILQVGGVDKVFRQKFNIRDDEKLLNASQCYLSTTAGPIAGLLFVSNHRVAFCSDRSIKLSSPTGKPLKAHYKVMIPLRKIKRAAESENVKKPTQKYVQIVTDDNFEFWFMGFLNHQRTLKYLQQAIHQAR
ncbi:putative GEM-like protein 8 [Sesamum indicum]|uniref:GEM-like protein 8 n=1 Tax=Sesamum indicum TaxID=4182 RepID=A0A6I9SL08_SESIN|nr:putative GEM-like protein 8 [Sesamum indicum]XP_011070467.1 putative GEM-like protein 8 [Sesamum indicum]